MDKAFEQKKELIHKIFNEASEKSLLKFICSLDEKRLLKILCLYLRTLYDNVIATEEYIYAKGIIPICMVAHVDTIRDLSMIVGEFEPITFIDEKMDTIHCLGGGALDDRLGVFIIIRLLQLGYRPSVIFTTGEEVGCTGARKLILDIPRCPDRNLKFFIEVDRQGVDEVVYYQNSNQAFKNFIESFGFVEQIGTISDISVLMSGWKIGGCNVSAGYINEHTSIETGSWSGVQRIIARLEDILNYDLSLLAKKRFKYMESKHYFDIFKDPLPKDDIGLLDNMLPADGVF